VRFKHALLTAKHAFAKAGIQDALVGRDVPYCRFLLIIHISTSTQVDFVDL
jgi:hypothetical protein